jgi:uncharacterized protein YndB with AHSA1/START domain
MSEQVAAMRSIVVERVMPHPPEKIWRALTKAHLIEQWLMTNNFEPRLGSHFTFGRSRWAIGTEQSVAK